VTSPEIHLRCISCGASYPELELRYTCECGDLLSIERPEGWAKDVGTETFDARLASGADVDRSGVFRFREGILTCAESDIVTHPEGNTRLYRRDALSSWAGIENLQFKHEGENPTGSFKDRGMCVAVTQARRLGATAVACASTGNTSSSLASYAGQAGLGAVVFVPSGKIAMGKLAQTLAYGALCLKVRGDFDAAMKLVIEASKMSGIYLVNSINPFRIEGQKAIVWELLQDRRWKAPDWIVVPAGNLGNTSAFGKALLEAFEGGWIDRLPRIASVQATGANPFYLGYEERWERRHRVKAETVASAIRIGDPVSWDRARSAIEKTNGVVTQVTDEELLEAKRQIDRSGIGCEPASACSLAGARKLRMSGVIGEDDEVVCVLTGHVLKDPDVIVNDATIADEQVVEIDPDLDAVLHVIEEKGRSS
jgi:threonine synthase